MFFYKKFLASSCVLVACHGYAIESVQVLDSSESTLSESSAYVMSMYPEQVFSCLSSCQIPSNPSLDTQPVSFEISPSAQHVLGSYGMHAEFYDSMSSLGLLGASVPSYFGAVSSGGSGPQYMVVNGSTGYVVNNPSNNVGVLDLSIPGSARLVTTVSSGLGNQPNYMAINGTTAYVANYIGGVGVLDISTPQAPVLKMSTSAGDNGSGYIAIRGTTAYVSNFPGSIGILDISTPGSASFIGTVTAGLPATRNMAVRGTTGYVVSRNGCLGIIDLSTAGSATFLGSISTGGLTPTFVIANGTSAFVANEDSGSVALINIATPGSASLIGTVSSGGTNPKYLTVNGTTLYAINKGSNNIGLIDISLPGSATYYAVTPSGGSAPEMMAISGNLAYVPNSAVARVGVFDISSPIPNLLTSLFSGGNGPCWIAVNGPTGYVTNQGSGSVGVFGFIAPPPALPTVLPVNISGPGGRTAAQLNQMSLTNNLSAANRAFYNKLLSLQGDFQITAITDAGSQHKVIQYQIEKLDLLLHKELDHKLYSCNEGTQGFILGGYDNLKQRSVNGYPGYNVNHYYQMLGLTHDWASMKWLIAVSGSESYEKLKPSVFSAKASYYTAWGTLGVSSRHNRFRYGLDALFGYSFINARRTIQYLDLKARTNHGLWNVSVDGKIAYDAKIKKVTFTPYDNVGYLYGHENDYKEHGAPGANLSIFDENVSMIRNQLGVKIKDPLFKTTDLFFDSAWVYEHYFGHRNYKQQFIGSTIVQDVTQTVPASNYLRLNAGFEGTYNDFNWKVAYTGLYGKRLADSAISLDFGYKF